MTETRGRAGATRARPLTLFVVEVSSLSWGSVLPLMDWLVPVGTTWQLIGIMHNTGFYYFENPETELIIVMRLVDAFYPEPIEPEG